MSLTYFDAASTLFGRREFSVGEFRRRVGSPRAAKVLNELKTRGLVERMGRGRYRCLGPEERPDLRAVEWRRVRDVMREAPLWWAWAGSSAVEAWTRGRYKLSPSPFVREFHVGIHETDRKKWEAYLHRHGVSTGAGKHIGAHVSLESLPRDTSVEEIGGEPVLGRDEVLRLIREHPALYESAEALLA